MPEQPTTESLELTAPADPAVVDAVQDGLAALWERCPDLPPGVALRFELGLVEILGNVVEHAFDPDHPGRALRVVVRVEDGTVHGELADNGEPAAVDLSAVTMPDADAESGRGLALALASLDALDYQRRGGTNVWLLRCGGATT
jgi:serine/threonine-protein kinase RsbW